MIIFACHIVGCLRRAGGVLGVAAAHLFRFVAVTSIQNCQFHARIVQLELFAATAAAQPIGERAEHAQKTLTEILGHLFKENDKGGSFALIALISSNSHTSGYSIGFSVELQ